jgi:hypothetical protein
MDDIDAAKSIISAIIDQEILELVSLPQETVVFSEKQKISSIRVDFTAIVTTENGKKRKIRIEMQKARLLSDIKRFRQYLGENYIKSDHLQENDLQLPFTCIYFLGYSTGITFPILSNTVEFKEAFNGEKIEEMDTFMELLTHNTHLIYIENLSEDIRKHPLFKLLSVFDQKYHKEGLPGYYLESDEFDEIVEPKLKHLIMRLQQAALEKSLLEKAKMEEDFNKDLESVINKYIYEAETQRLLADEERKLKDEALKKIEALEKALAKKQDDDRK